MLFIIALIVTVILLSMFRITGSVIVGILASMAVFILTDSMVVAYLFYFICIIPWGKFDEKRRWSRRNRTYDDRSDNSYNNANSEAVQTIPNIYERACPTNVYYIETLNINNAPQQQNLPLSANIYDNHIEDRQDDGWKITGVDWEALEKGLRSQGR